MPQTIVQIEDWGIVDYQEAWKRQRQTVDAVIAGASGRLIFCEHPPVLTLGRMTKPNSLLFPREEIEAQGMRIQAIDRGGDVTLHAPGQMLVYVIMDLNKQGRDLKVYLEKLEQVAVDLLKDFGILAISIPGKRGVFVPTVASFRRDPDRALASVGVGDQKIISIGIGVRKWITYHGLGINVNTDLSLFRFIRPCGLDVRMTSMAKELGRPVEMMDVREAFIKQFHVSFPRKQESKWTPDDLWNSPV